MRGRFILFLAAFALLTARGQAADETTVATESAATTTVAAATVDATAATTADPILISIPDAGGLRITVRSGNKLHVFVAGHDVPEDIPTTSIVNLHVTAGYVDGGTITTGKDHAWNNLFGTGLNVKIKTGTVLTANPTGVSFAGTASAGGVTIVLPLKSSSDSSTGSAVGAAAGAAGTAGAAGGATGSANANKVEIAVSTLSIERTGKLHLVASADNPAHPTSFTIPGGFTIAANSLAIDYTHNPGGEDDDATISVHTIQITAPIPGILTQNPAPLVLVADSGSINTDGQVTFQGAHLKAPGGTAATHFADSAAGVQVASRATFAPRRKALPSIPNFPIRIPLMAPADFVITLNGANAVSLDMTNNVPTGFTITCDIDLPSTFTKAPTGSDRVTAHNVKLDISTGGFTAQLPTDDQPDHVLLAYFKGFGVKISDASLDLSDTKSIAYPTGATHPPGDVAWEGIYLKSAELVPPDDLKVNDDSGKLLPLTLTNCWIDNNGFTGAVELKDGAGGSAGSRGSVTIDDYIVKLDNFTVNIEHSSIKDCNIAGSVSITSLMVANTDKSPNAPAKVPAKITIVASVADSGLASLQVQTSVIPLDDFKADMQIEKGSVEHDTNGKVLLALTGNFAFRADANPRVAGLKVQVDGLQIDSTGNFAVDKVWINLPESASLDCELVKIDAKQIGFGGIGPGKTAWVGFNGEVSIGGDLPVQAKADFEGLFIYADGDVRVGKIGIDCNIKDIVHIVGYLEETDGTMTRSLYTQNGKLVKNIDDDGKYKDETQKVDPKYLTLSDGKPLKILQGQVKVQLPILGGPAAVDPSDAASAIDDDSDDDDDTSSSGGPGGKLQFMIARNCWFVLGSFSATTPLIPLGESGMAIYGFGGGLGYNIKPEIAGSTGTPAIDYQIIPDIDAIEGKTSVPGPLNIIAIAAVRLGTVAAPAPVWGDVVLIADVGHLTFTLEGNCYLAQAMPPDVPASPAAMDRVLSAKITFDAPNKTFTIDGFADLCIPKKELLPVPNNPGFTTDHTFLRVYAPFAVKIGNYDSNKDAGFVADQSNPPRVFYAKLGGPVDLGDSTTQNGVTAHRSIVINNPVTLKIRSLSPLQAAMTLDMNAGEFTTAFSLDQKIHEDSGGVQKYDVVVGDVRLATVKYAYSLDGEFKSSGFFRATFPGFAPKAKTANTTDMTSFSAQGEFYVYAMLDGKATNLRIEPRILPNFSLPDIGISAVVEAALQGELTPTYAYLSGQVYADVKFQVGDYSLSEPFSESIGWGYKL